MMLAAAEALGELSPAQRDADAPLLPALDGPPRACPARRHGGGRRGRP